MKRHFLLINYSDVQLEVDAECNSYEEVLAKAKEHRKSNAEDGLHYLFIDDQGPVIEGFASSDID